jgi:hypothetical protein
MYSHTAWSVNQAEERGLTSVAGKILDLCHFLEILLVGDSVTGNDEDDTVNHVFELASHVQLHSLHMVVN